MKKLFIFILLLTAVFSQTFAQKADMLNPQNYFYAGKLALFNTFSVANPNSDSLVLNSFAKIVKNNLLYVQNRDGKYFAQYSIEFTLADAEGVIRFHKIYTDSVYSDVNLFSNNEFSFLQKYYSFVIPNKGYLLSIRTIDLNSKQSDKVELSYIIKSSVSEKYASMIPIVKSNEDSYSVNPLNNNIPFSAKSVRFLLCIPNSQNFNQIKYRIYKVKENNELWDEKIDLAGKLENSLSAPAFKQENNILKYIDNSNNASFTTTSADYSATLDYYEVNLKNNPLVPGIYTMQIMLGSKDSINIKFKVIWDDLPLTLTNMPIALKISEYFFKESEMDKINDGSRNEQFSHLIDAWEQFNPNKEVKYNDALMEFYRRADYSFFNYSTFSQKNGALTDKAKIYILNGPPDETKQLFKNGKLFEKWTYRRVIKEYTFESIEAGVFKLVQIKE